MAWACAWSFLLGQWLPAEFGWPADAKQEELLNTEFRKQAPELAAERQKVAALELERAKFDSTILSTLVSMSVPSAAFLSTAQSPTLTSWTLWTAYAMALLSARSS